MEKINPNVFSYDLFEKNIENTLNQCQLLLDYCLLMARVRRFRHHSLDKWKKVAIFDKRHRYHFFRVKYFFESEN